MGLSHKLKCPLTGEDPRSRHQAKGVKKSITQLSMYVYPYLLLVAVCKGGHILLLICIYMNVVQIQMYFCHFLYPYDIITSSLL